MKSLLFCSLLFASTTYLFAQTTDSLGTISMRGCYDFYVDGILIRKSCGTQLPKRSYNIQDAREIKVITGGTIGDWCDPNGGIIQDSVTFYIDGIKVRSCRSKLRNMNVEKVEVITGGFPATYGDLNSSIIRVNTTPAIKTPAKMSNKKENMATE